MAVNNNSSESVHIIFFPKFGLKIDKRLLKLIYVVVSLTESCCEHGAIDALKLN